MRVDGVLPLTAMQAATAYPPHYLEDSQAFSQMEKRKVKRFTRIAQMAMSLEPKTSVCESLDLLCYFMLSISN